MAGALAEARRRGEEVAAQAARLGISVETVKWWAWRKGSTYPRVGAC
jgi:hypothetical protein